MNKCGDNDCYFCKLVELSDAIDVNPSAYKMIPVPPEWFKSWLDKGLIDKDGNWLD